MGRVRRPPSVYLAGPYHCTQVHFNGTASGLKAWAYRLGKARERGALCCLGSVRLSFLLVKASQLGLSWEKPTICKEAQYTHWFPGVKSDRTLPQFVIGTLGKRTDVTYISPTSQRDFSNR